MKRSNLSTAIGLILATGGLVACGGGDIGSTPTTVSGTAVGVITGFGSIYVNGIEYFTNSTTYHVDDENAFDDSSLDIGMVVKIRGSVNADGRTGIATAVYYDDELEGPVQGLATDPSDSTKKTFSIFGIDVVVSNTTRFDNEDDPSFSFDTLADGDNVEVSGFFHNNTLIASYLEKQDSLDDDFEVKGTVSASTGSSFVLTHKNGGTLNVTVASGAEIPSAGIVDGQYVEVEGTIPDPAGAPNDLLASKVELEDDDLFDDSDFDGENDEAEVRGILSYDATADGWSINGQEVDFGSVSEYKPASLASSISDTSADGMTLKIEGHFEGGILYAREVKSDFDDDGDGHGNLEIKGTVDTVSAIDLKTGTITLSFGNASGTVDVDTNGSTLFMNDDSMSHFTLNNLAAGDYVEVKAYQDDLGNTVATYMERDDSLGEYELEGPVDAYNAGSSITILGVTFDIDDGTFVEDTPVVGQLGELEDNDRDGIAETVDRED